MSRISAAHDPTSAELQAMRYPSTITSYEMERAIIRTEIDGMVYVHCPDYGWTCRALDREREERKREEARKRYADHVAEAYAGGTP